MNDMRDMRGMDGRRLPPRNARGEFMSRGRGRGRGRRGDRGMDYGMYPEMHGDGRVIRSYPRMDYAGDMNYDMARGDMRGDYRGRQMSDRGDYGDMRRGDGHHYPQGQGATYYPIQAMGTFEGYYGMPQEDYGRGRDYGYPDMRAYNMSGMRDYGDYRRGDYGYIYGDFGEVLSEKELDEWCHKLKSKLDEREKQMFSKEIISQKAKQMGKEMKDFGEKELEVVTLMLLDDYKRTLGVNPDVMIKLAFDWLNDEDAKVRGAQKLAVYFDEIVMGGEE